MEKEDRNTSHDGLDEYIRVSSSGLLIIIGALSLVLVATVVWGFAGKLPVTLTVTGCVVDTEFAAAVQSQESDATADGDEFGKAWVVCFVDSSKFSAEQIMKFNPDVTISMPDRSTFKGKIEDVSPYPLSRDEAHSFLEGSEWMAEQCVTSNYSWGLIISVHDDISDHLFTTPEVTIITDEVPPIRFLTR